MTYQVTCSDGVMRDADNSRLLDVHRQSEYPEVNEMVDQLYQAHFSDLPFKDKAKLKKHVKTLLLDAYVSWMEDTEQALSISLNKNAYRAKSRYNALHISETMIAVAHQAVEAGLLVWWQGHETAERTSRFWPTQVLKDAFLKIGVFPLLISSVSNYEPIILRDIKNGKQVNIEYGDHRPKGITKAKLKAMREQLWAYHRRLAHSFIDIPSLEDSYVTLAKEKHKASLTEDGRALGKLVMLIAINAKDEASAIKAIRNSLSLGVQVKTASSKVHISPHDKRIRRIFNNGRFDEGGRFYGGWWQRLPSEWRQKIWIDGEAVAEIDYSAFHIILLYARLGVDYFASTSEDPYRLDLPDFSEGLTDNAILGLITRLREKHPTIASQFCSNAGVGLMNLDAEIASHVLQSCLDADITPLIIHDSFIVQAHHVDTLRGFMADAVAEYFDITPKVKQAMDARQVFTANFGDPRENTTHRYRLERNLFARFLKGNHPAKARVLLELALEDVRAENERLEIEEALSSIEDKA